MRQSQEALLKVDGDVTINGPLDLILDQAPADLSSSTTVPLIEIVSPSGTLTGEFLQPITVTLTYPEGVCSTSDAMQSKAGKSLSVLVTVDGSRCTKGKGGLSTGAKVAIGVVVGVVGLLILLLVAFFAIRRFAPATAHKCDAAFHAFCMLTCDSLPLAGSV